MSTLDSSPLTFNVGPVVGLVTKESARILIETNVAVPDLQVTIFQAQQPSQVVQQSKVQTLAKKPIAFTIYNLQPDTQYRVAFSHPTRNLLNKDDYSASFYTNPVVVSQMKIGCVSCNYLEHRSRKKGWDLWQHFAHEVQNSRIDLLLHMGDQIYADGISITGINFIR